jgi:uncharacterized protein YjbJ (UPF0337 family)
LFAAAPEAICTAGSCCGFSDQSIEKENAMNWDRVEGNWKQFKGKVKEKWGDLTDDDLNVIDGKKDQLAGKLQERYGYGKDKAQQEVDEFCNMC